MHCLLGGATDSIRKWLRFRIQENTVALPQAALDVKQRFGISCRDAHIVAAARLSRRDEILSEDHNHGQDHDGVKVVNPFARKA